MLQKMRTKAQGLGSKVIFGLVIFALAAFGFGGSSFFQSSEQPAATVNGVEVTRFELERAAQQRKESLRAEYGDEFLDLLDTGAISRVVLSELIQRALAKSFASDLGLLASEKQVDEVILNDPAFELAGEFSPDLFRQRVASIGFTPERYREEKGDELRLSALQEAVLDSSFVPSLELRQLAQVSLQTRDIAWLEFDSELYQSQVEVSEEELATAYQLRLAEFMTDTRVDAQYLELRLEDIAGSAEFEPEESSIRAAYDAEVSEFGGAEQRDAAHILLAVDESRSEEQAIEEARSLRERILAGAPFEELARELSDDPGSAAEGGSLGPAGAGVYVPPFEEALWALQEGELSDPVVTQFGVHLIRLDAIIRSDPPSFEERRGAIEQELRGLAALDRFVEIKLEVDDLAFDAQSSLDPLLEKFDLVLQEEMGVTEWAGAGVFTEAALREALFASDVKDSGFNSPLIELGEDLAYVVRASDVHEATQIPFEEVREQLHQEIQGERARELASQAAEAALQALLSGAGASEVAETEQAWQRRDAMRRNESDVPQEVIGAAFELPRPASGQRSMDISSLGDGASVLVVVSGVRDGDTAEIPDSELQSLSDQIGALVRQRELASLYRDLRETADIESELLEE